MATKAIRECLAKGAGPGPEWPFELEDLAAAALMVECAHLDGECAEEEWEAICRAVKESFLLDEETAECLIRMAARREDEVWHDQLFTEMINASFDQYEKLLIIGRLWETALADGIVHPFEERLIARIASELGIAEEAVGRLLTLTLRRHPRLTSVAPEAATAPAVQP